MPVNDQSILNTVKKGLSIDPDDTDFDPELITFINGELGTFHQIGVGPVAAPFEIEDNAATWVQLLGLSTLYASAKALLILRVRLIFDPPPTSYAQTAIEKNAERMQWRLMIAAEQERLNPTLPQLVSGETYIISDESDFPPEAPIGAIGFDPDTGNVWKNT